MPKKKSRMDARCRRSRPEVWDKQGTVISRGKDWQIKAAGVEREGTERRLNVALAFSIPGRTGTARRHVRGGDAAEFEFELG